jgi:two-component system response regulator ResD
MTDIGAVNARRIMIITDDDVVRDSVEMGLADAGYTIRSTASGHDALRWLGEEPWDVLVIDLKLPGMDGAQLYRRVLARCPMGRPRVLFVAGYDDCSGYESDPEVLAVPLLFKPFTGGELFAAVQRILETTEPCRILIGPRPPLS